jgi:hypothetical protein
MLAVRSPHCDWVLRSHSGLLTDGVPLSEEFPIALRVQVPDKHRDTFTRCRAAGFGQEDRIIILYCYIGEVVMIAVRVHIKSNAMPINLEPNGIPPQTPSPRFSST